MQFESVIREQRSRIKAELKDAPSDHIRTYWEGMVNALDWVLDDERVKALRRDSD
jgi:hypothetical protein